ncbi:hypothetical protein [Hymenobacter canadensis]|uniref:STAS/SEC14 domain-containing protein n=1 Tax=Hymenobacter canadensis TaxID=2999067 RepID=A0ABY7LN45_9BACT|nr:hypothetical protein [Hymenobacter canadensis]WBA41867.1 hypothetical protein O3303_18915 [Hymenobacter canadensis]
MTLKFENDTTRIYYDDTIPGLVQVWNGFANGAPLRAAHEALLQLQQQYGTAKSLSDLRLMRVIPRADQQWIQEVFFPQALAAGYRAVAIITSEDVFNQTSVKNILLHVGQNDTFQAEYFQEEATARAWLAQLP